MYKEDTETSKKKKSNLEETNCKGEKATEN